ncbi:hypothetical protein LMZ02_13965 [Paenibacillus macerans]|uniref:hypothetical protein n=1 Tax=Paenibacillus macerans TaxID=44252 RepID=UPI001F0DF2FE|nr:hypothetical protein [Paenibacillus macerans]UMV50382.1 hypothetical protein LMZ02_13965 [Paenibacillus macerans]
MERRTARWDQLQKCILFSVNHHLRAIEMQKIQLPECTSTDVFLTAVSAPAAAAGRSAAAGGAGAVNPMAGGRKNSL